MALAVVWCDDLVRLNPADGSVLDAEGEVAAAPPVRLAAGRGEYASAQVLIGPVPAGLAVEVVPAALRGPDGAALAPDQWDVFVAWCHQLDGRWYPEVAVPQAVVGGWTPAFRKLNGTAALDRAPFWLDLFIPADARPGAYTGSITVKAGGERVDVPVEVEVRRTAIGGDTTLDISMNNYADTISGTWPGLLDDPRRFWTPRYRRIERGVFRACHEHRAFLHYLPYTHAGYVYGDYAPPLTGEGEKRRVAKWGDWDRHFGPYFDGSAFSGTRRGAIPVKRFWMPLNLCWPSDFLKFGQPGYAAEWRAVGRDLVQHFRQKGWTRTCFDMFLNHKQRFRFFPWDTEECRFLPDQDLHRYVRTFWEGTFDWKSTQPVKFQYTLGTTWTYHIDVQSDLAEFIDVFIAGTGGPAMFPEFLPKLHAHGRQVWSCTHSGNIPAGPRAAAFTPLMGWMRDLDGLMPQWLTTGSWRNDPWRNLPDKGQTTMLYPGVPFDSEETFVSLRFKAFRNTLQVVDELQAAANATGNRPAVQERVNQVLGWTRQSWFAKAPEYMQKKLPKDWQQADFATEEPPIAEWEKISPAVWRDLRRVAASLAAPK